MKTLHLPLLDDTYAKLRAAAERSKVPAREIAREAIDLWLRHQSRKIRHDAIATYAAEMAGTDVNLDAKLEAAGVEHLITASKDSQ